MTQGQWNVEYPVNERLSLWCNMTQQLEVEDLRANSKYIEDIERFWQSTAKYGLTGWENSLIYIWYIFDDIFPPFQDFLEIKYKKTYKKLHLKSFILIFSNSSSHCFSNVLHKKQGTFVSHKLVTAFIHVPHWILIAGLWNEWSAFTIVMSPALWPSISDTTNTPHGEGSKVSGLPHLANYWPHLLPFRNPKKEKH